MYAIITFDSEQHKDNEKVRVQAPFATMDQAHTWAESNCKFWHIVRMAHSGTHVNGGLRVTNIREAERQAVNS
jgi:hypothetical protein